APGDTPARDRRPRALGAIQRGNLNFFRADLFMIELRQKENEHAFTGEPTFRRLGRCELRVAHGRHGFGAYRLSAGWNLLQHKRRSHRPLAATGISRRLCG
ncbi:MAG TPA: hypothetical protein VKT76_08940, partial [Bradyrhizobium sp.]|nr:hypothetical protein [Bradyrhizobium sp.]